MQVLIKILFLVLILSSQGCQIIEEYLDEHPAMLGQPIDQLFAQGMRYQLLDRQPKLLKCKQLLKVYQSTPHWETGWLLVHSLNPNFNCFSLNKALLILKNIQRKQGMSSQLVWFNKNQIQLFKKLRKRDNLQSQLKEAEVQLQQVISKLQALKEIETSINKKLDNE